ncbi:MAG TPA: carbohydrate kinase [Tepidisphaeraceae bacterium]|nr:carbohydrate kinase [Tepidisphaeraceae bacterium]
MANENGPLVIGVGEILWDMLPAGRQLGGAPANFAFHAQQLGARGAVVSRVGDDSLGQEILEKLDAAGVDRRGVGVDPQHPTGVVDVTLDKTGVPTYAIRTGAAWDFIEASDINLALAKSADAICFGTLGQRNAESRRAIGAILAAAKTGEGGCLKVFDINLRQQYYSAELLDAMLKQTDVLKFNEDELPMLARLLGMRSAGDHSVGAIVGRYPVKYVALTRGSAGAYIYGVDSRHSYPGVACKGGVADTVGAGDAFTAALVMGLLAGRPIEWINEFANRLAAYVCSQHGAMPALSAELRAAWNAGA